MRKSGYPAVKRGLDFALASALVLILSPLFAVISLGALIFHGRPIFYSQERPGLRGELFTILKFRTMKAPKPDKVPLLGFDQVTQFGNILRRLSLDELPQLLNVIRGDMSLIGPRPLLVEYLPLYNEHQSQRHSVRPGITGLAQARGRNLLSWEERLELDVEYVSSYSFARDVEILGKSLAAVIVGRGVSPNDSPLMPKFSGTSAGTLPDSPGRQTRGGAKGSPAVPSGSS